MKPELKKITIRELTKAYKDDEHNGIFGFGWNLDIRLFFLRQE